jgi:copper chaperone CopZ
MIRITVKMDGMMCGMCEAHVNDALRRALPVKKVTSNHRKKETVILSEQDIPDSAIHAALADTGYLPLGIAREEEKPRGLAALFRK